MANPFQIERTECESFFKVQHWKTPFGFYLAILIFLSPILSGAEPMNKLKVGWASRDISTDKPVAMRGQMYLRISTGILDPLTLTALVIDNGDDSVIFLSIDCVLIKSYLVKEIRENVRKLNPEIPSEKIIINATHTHTGGDIFADEIDDFSSDVPRMPAKEYSDFVVTQAADAVAEAWENRRPGGLAWGYGYAVSGHQRRVIYYDDYGKRGGGGFLNLSGHLNGHGVLYGNTNDSQFKHYETGADPFVNLLYTFDEDNKLTGAIINISSPSQSSENISMLSADFWNEVRIALKKEYGDINILPQSAAAGDISPRILHYTKAEARRFKLKYGPEESKNMAERKDIAERISDAFTETLLWAKNDIRKNLPIKHISETVELPRLRITEEQYKIDTRNLLMLKFAIPKINGTTLERLHHDSKMGVFRSSCRSIVERYNTQDKDPNLPMEMHIVKIGEIAFASNRFEMYIDYMHRIQGRSPFDQTFIIQLAGSEVGEGGGTYLPTQRATENKGYSATPYSNLVGPEGGQKLVEETVSILNQLYDQSR